MKRKLNLTIISLFTFVLITLAMLGAAHALAEEASTCPPLYNGGIVCQDAQDFKVDKKVQTPKDGSYVDYIDPNDLKIAPERTMIFRIQVTNKTDKTLSGITVTDTLPDFVTFVKADRQITQNKQQITYTVTKLEGQKTDTVNIEATVNKKESLPTNTDTVCVANQVEAKSGFLIGVQDAKDFVTFCIDPNIPPVVTQTTDTTPQTTTMQPSFPGQTTKGGLPVATPTPSNMTKGGQTVYPSPSATTNPNTGPEALYLIALLPAGLGGLFLRRKTK